MVAPIDGLIQQLVLGNVGDVTRPMIHLAISRICNIGSAPSSSVGTEDPTVMSASAAGTAP